MYIFPFFDKKLHSLFNFPVREPAERSDSLSGLSAAKKQARANASARD